MITSLSLVPADCLVWSHNAGHSSPFLLIEQTHTGLSCLLYTSPSKTNQNLRRNKLCQVTQFPNTTSHIPINNSAVTWWVTNQVVSTYQLHWTPIRICGRLAWRCPAQPSGASASWGCSPRSHRCPPNLTEEGRREGDTLTERLLRELHLGH